MESPFLDDESLFVCVCASVRARKSEKASERKRRVCLCVCVCLIIVNLLLSSTMIASVARIRKTEARLDKTKINNLEKEYISICNITFPFSISSFTLSFSRGVALNEIAAIEIAEAGLLKKETFFEK